MVYESKAAERREKLRDALIGAAERTIETDGLRALRARELAAEVGCAVGAIYNAVADLDELIYAANARTLAALEESLNAAGAKHTAGGASAQLVRLALAYMEFAVAHPQRWRAIFQHQPPLGREIPEDYLADQLRLFSYIEEPLRSLLPDVAPARGALIARSLFSAVHGMVVLGLEEKLLLLPLPVLREQITLIVEAAARGLAQGPK